MRRLHAAVAFRLALRGLARSPGTTILAGVVLTLGLAAPTTFFSLLVGAIRPLPVPEGERVVRVEVVQPTRGGRQLAPTLEDLGMLQHAGSLESLGAFQTFQGTLLEPGRAAARLSGAALTREVLPLLRVEPALGRIPEPGEAGETILLAHDLWVEAFDAEPGILGRVVLLDGVPRTVTGVLPAGFRFPFNERAWTVIPDDAAPGEGVELVGRLAEGSTPTSAETELAGIWRRSDPLRDPERSGGALEVDGFTGGRGESGEGIAFLGLVLVAMALLLIACSNVANLLLVRATERVRGLAVQAALGAGREQLGLQLALESLLVAALGGVGGVALAWVSVEWIQHSLAAEHFGYFWMRMAVDGRVLAFTGILVLGTALVAGIVPVVRVVRSDLQGVLKEAGGGALGGGGRWSRAFVTAQLALSCGALVAAGLAGHALVRSGDFGGSLASEETLVASLTLDAETPGAVMDELEAALAALPRSRGIALAAGAPGFMEPWGRVEVEGEAPGREEEHRSTGWNAVSPGYLALFGMELRAGRWLTEADREGAPRVAVVSTSFAVRFFPGEDALGRRVRVSGADTVTWATIVGVVEDLDLGAGPGERRERVYLPIAQTPRQEIVALLRFQGEVEGMPGELRKAVREVAPAVPVWSIRTLADAHAYLIRIPRAMGGIALGGGVAGLLVAVVGLYALLAFRVRQRRRELGLRLALGADGARLAREVMELALRQLLPAVAVGVAMAWLAAPVMAVSLMGGDPRSPAVYLMVAGVFLGTGVVAALVPALRAAALDPSRVLRGE